MQVSESIGNPIPGVAVVYWVREYGRAKQVSRPLWEGETTQTLTVAYGIGWKLKEVNHVN
jgi:hypothetical protein